MRDETVPEKLLRAAFWCCLWGLALYGVYVLGRRYSGWISAACVVLLVGGIAVAERRPR